MQLRRSLAWRVLVAPLAVALTLAACGGGGVADTDAGAEATADGGGVPERGPTITVGSFNFGESVTIAEIYAQAMEAEGYPVDRALDLATRERIYADLESGAIDLLPEYLASALGVGFGGEPSSDPARTAEALREEVAALGLTVLAHSPAQDQNVFVVTAGFAEEHDLSSIGDLAQLDEVVLGGPPECEDRATCLVGLRDVYGLDNVSFRSIQETPDRVSSLRDDEIDVALMFSTDPPLQSGDLVALEETEGMIAAENVAPVVNDEILDAYGDDLVALLDAISGALTTEDLIDMNTQVYVEGADPAGVARAWLDERGFLEGLTGAYSAPARMVSAI